MSVKWLVLKVDDRTIVDGNFPTGIKVSALAEEVRVLYNFTHRCFGYLDDARHWTNAGDEWLEPKEMAHDAEGKLVLYFDANTFPYAWYSITRGEITEEIEEWGRVGLL